MAANSLLTLHNLIAQASALPELSLQASSGCSQTSEPLESQSRQNLSGIIMLAGVKQLEQRQTLGCLDPGLKKTVLSSDRLQAASKLLYQRLLEFSTRLPPEAWPEPCLPKTSLEFIWSSFQQPDLDKHWRQNHTLGYIYQFYCRPRRSANNRVLQNANKSLDLSQLIAFTQLYTPEWVVDFLLQNTVLSQWSGNSLKPPLPYYLSSTGNSTHTAAQLRILDPACGSGNFLLNAFDLLLQLYQAEAISPAEALPVILKHNLAGVDIDPPALWITALGMLIKSWSVSPASNLQIHGLSLPPGGCPKTGNTLLGSLIRPDKDSEHLLAKKYHAVVANPPYLGRKLLDRQLKSALKTLYPDAHHDLCAAFLQRGLELLHDGGRLGIITQAPLMFLPSYGKLRQNLVEDNRLIAAVDLGPGVFPLQAGEKIDSALLLVESQPPACNQAQNAFFLNLQGQANQPAALKSLGQKPDSLNYKEVNPLTFRRHRKYAFNYDCPDVVLEVMEQAPKLSKQAELRQGLATTDNKRFLRFWWDVDAAQIGHRWFPYIKGAGNRKWHAEILTLVDWEDNGASIKQAVAGAYPYLKGKTEWVVKNERYYFKPGLTFSFVSSKSLCVRKLPAGCIFDVGGSAVFAQPEKLDFLLAYLNSSFATAMAVLLNPTLNFQVGDLKQLPVIDFPENIELKLVELSKQCQDLKRDLSCWDAHAYDRQPLPPMLDEKSIERELQNHLRQTSLLSDLEKQLNQVVMTAVIKHFALPPKDSEQLQSWIDARQTGVNACSLNRADIAYLLVQEQLRKLLQENQFVLLSAGNFCRQLEMNPQICKWIEAQCGTSIERYLCKAFISEHTRRFFKSPLYQLAPLTNESSWVLFSSQVLRNGTTSSGKYPTAQSSQDPAQAAAQNLLSSLKPALQSIPDWTGADLQAQVKKFTS